MKKLITAILTAAMLLCTPVFAVDDTSVAPPKTTEVAFVKAVADVTGDGKVTSLDAAMILRHDAGLIDEFIVDSDIPVLSSRDLLPLGDVNADGSITSLDAALVLMYDAGLIVLPGEEPVPGGDTDESAGSSETPSLSRYTAKDIGNGSTAVVTDGTHTNVGDTACTLITSVKELADYVERSEMGLGKEAFLKAAAKYDDEYFKHGVIAVSALVGLTPETVLEAESVLCTEEGQLNIVIRVRRPLVYDLDYTYWHVITECNASATSARLVRAGGTYFFPEEGLLEGAQAIRISDPEERQDTHLIRSRTELDAYLADYPDGKDDGFYLSDCTMGLHRACKAYDDAFFEDNYLTIVSAVQGSGSFAPFVLASGVTEDGDVRVDYAWICPEEFTDDMAYWRLLIPVSKEGVTDDATVIKNSKSINFGTYNYDVEYVKRWCFEYTVIYFDGADGYQYCFADEKLYDTLSSLDYSGEGTGTSQYRMEFKNGVYDVNLTEGYVFCDKGRASLNAEQLAAVKETVEFAEYCAIAFGIKG